MKDNSKIEPLKVSNPEKNINSSIKKDFLVEFNEIKGIYDEFNGMTSSYWENLKIMYNLVNNNEIKKFISDDEDLKILLLHIPYFCLKTLS
ncbi:MAG: hypothetical protein FWH29_04595 [Methanobrevibacter sp.]|nr:hypothetical protein [Methanobrevibacter sp.]